MKSTMDYPSGFTLIEILIVLTVIGLIGVFSAIAIGTARSEQRDAVRLAHIRELQSVLEDHFVETNTYPQGNNLVLGGDSAGCLSVSGFQPSCSSDTEGLLMRRVPATITSGLKSLVTCGDTSKAYCYQQQEEGNNYTIEFEIENDWPLSGLKEGVNCAHAEGIRSGSCK